MPNKNDVRNAILQSMSPIEYVTTTQRAIDDSLVQALLSAEPLGERQVYTVVSGGGATYDMPTGTFAVEQVTVEDPSLDGSRYAWPKGWWDYDQNANTVVFQRKPEADFNIYFTYTALFDWTGATLTPSTITKTNYGGIPYTPVANEILSIAQSWTSSADVTAYGINFEYGYVESDIEVTFTVSPDTAGSPATSYLWTYKEKSYAAGTTTRSFEFPTPLNLQAATTYWFKVAVDEAATTDTLQFAKDTGGAYGFTTKEYSTAGGWATVSYDIPFQWRTAEQTIELDPEYIRYEAMARLYEKIMSRPDSIGQRAAGLTQFFHEQATKRKELLARYREMALMLEEDRR